MPAPQPRKTGLSPSPTLLALLIVILAVVAIGAITLVMTSITAPAPVQTDASSKSDQAQANPLAKRTAIPVGTATALADDDEEPNYATRVVPVPTDAELPPGFVKPTPLTEMPPTRYIPRPTASLHKLIPIEAWKEYVNAQQGFTIKYPPNWYLYTDPTGQDIQIYSYDINDPGNAVYKGSPRDISKIEIMVNRVVGDPTDQFLPNETLHDWVSRTGRLEEDSKLIQEQELTISGFPALRQLVQTNAGSDKVVYVKRTQDVIFIVQYYWVDLPVLHDMFQLFVANFKINQ